MKFIKIILSPLLLLLSETNIKAQSSPNKTILCGQIASNRDSIKLRCAFSNSEITGQGRTENIFFDCSLGKEGSFRIELPYFEKFARVSLFDVYSNNNLLSHGIITAGDSINISATILDQDDPDPLNFIAHFFGRGYYKFNCQQILKLIPIDNKMFMDQNPNKVASVLDSNLAVYYMILDRFRHRLEPQVYQLIKADITGDLKSRLIEYGKIFEGVYSDTIPKSHRSKQLIALNRISQSPQPPFDDSIIFSSTKYIEYLYEKSKMQFFFQNGEKKFRLLDFYNSLKRNYRGVVKDKILAYCLNMASDLKYFFDDSKSEDYSLCLKDAAESIKIPWLKQTIIYLSKSKEKGAEAFNFSLSRDSSNQKVTLSDLKGKVVLIDMWSDPCTACYEFADIFHRYVYPLFKDTPDFAVISINLNNSYDRYLDILRRKINIPYTNCDYINLFAGKGVDDGILMQKFYNINSWPLVLLINKSGKIFSSTIPFFTDERSPNIKKLVTLINEALQ